MGSLPLELSDDEDDEGEEKQYIVEKILDKVTKEDGSVFYAVKWEGYTKPTWEPSGNLKCEALLDEFEEQWRVRELEKKNRRASCLKNLVEKKTQAQIAAEKRRYGQLADTRPEEQAKNDQCKRELIAKLEKGKPEISSGFRIKKLGDPKSNFGKSSDTGKQSSSSAVTYAGSTTKENGHAISRPPSTAAKAMLSNGSSTNAKPADPGSRKVVINNPALVSAQKLSAKSSDAGKHAKTSAAAVARAASSQKPSSISNGKVSSSFASKKSAAKSSSSGSSSSSDGDSGSSSSSSSSSPSPTAKRKKGDPDETSTTALNPTSTRETRNITPNAKAGVVSANTAGEVAKNVSDLSTNVAATSQSAHASSSANGSSDSARELPLQHSKDDDAAKNLPKEPRQKYSFEQRLADGWTVRKVICVAERPTVADNNSKDREAKTENNTVTQKVVKLKVRTSSGTKRTEHVPLDEIRALPEDSQVIRMVVTHLIKNTIISN